MSQCLRIGLIGFGRMGKAIAVGFAKAGIEKACLTVYDKAPQARADAESLGFRVVGSAEDVFTVSNIIIVAVKPGDVEEALKNLADFASNKIVVSIAAATPLKKLENLLPKSTVYRAMPNVAVEINKGFIALSPPSRKNDYVEKVFSLLGTVEWVDEKILDMLTFYSASTPAMVAELFDTFLLSALRAGVPYNIAKKALSTVFQGVGALLEAKSVSDLRDSVITPRGVTIKAIEKIYVYGAKQTLLKALDDAYDEYERMLRED
ncbi:MAG: pyrroline-5-carboxylate reductase dimerization domain-containing protein [Ignisphaera sp.]